MRSQSRSRFNTKNVAGSVLWTTCNALISQPESVLATDNSDITDRKAAETALQALSIRLMEVQETERRFLARELHDEIGQLLTGLRILLRFG
jgi:signal transduction histidine kinase